MPFGLRNSGQTFQRHMHQVLAHLEFRIPYFDDLLIASSSEDEHLDHLHQILSRLRDYGLKLNPDKCVLAKTSVKFLGCLITAEEFFEPSSQTPTDPSEFLLRLRETFRTLKPTPASCHSSTSFFVHTALKTCSHVFVRVEGLKPSLTAPYQGPFEVLSRTDKHFIIKINDRSSTISIDRLKPAFLLNDTDWTKEPSPSQCRKVTIRLYFLLDLIKMCPYQPRLALVEGSDSTQSTCEFHGL
ncbi:transposon Ty3-I Gag-Pol polyprotein [Trichonephila clavata]|uniref:Transposon Ty3-I Gag-Pol polyprotein n=1 Tax=Trichonephila clavata TaxID=2740835 RepID=A0A8X6FMP3_TRICU|nr:transposon Ty3-I Gag-Pol polyprotein [Trichonephila clavata]